MLAQEMYPRIMQALDLISQGRTPTQACDNSGLTIGTLRKYIENDPVFREFAANAFQRGWDTMADILLRIDRDPEYGSSDPRIMRIMSDNIKWYLSRKNPAQYGERVIVENTFHADKTIVEALSRGRQRVLEAASKTIADDLAYEMVASSTDDLAEFL